MTSAYSGDPETIRKINEIARILAGEEGTVKQLFHSDKQLGPLELSAELNPDMRKAYSYEDKYVDTNLVDRTVSIHGTLVDLTETEFKLFAELVMRRGEGLRNEEAREAMYGEVDISQPAVSATVKRLFEKINNERLPEGVEILHREYTGRRVFYSLIPHPLDDAVSE